MKIFKTFGFISITPNSRITIRDFNNIIDINAIWEVSARFANGDIKKLHNDWKTNDLVNFIQSNIKDEDASLCFFNPKNELFYEVDEYRVFYDNKNYDLEFYVIKHQIIQLKDKWYVAIRDDWYKDYCIVFDVCFNSQQEAKNAIRTGKFFNIRNSYYGK